MLNALLENITTNKVGLEIGGPSEATGEVIYKNAKSVYNFIF